MGHKLVLLVEDDMNLRQSILLILQRAGLLITATDDVCEALEILRSGKYQLVISDLDVPGAPNVLLPKIQGNHPSLPVLILTDQSIAEIKKEGKSIHAHYLNKPVDPECILDCVDDILGKNGLTIT